MNSLPSPYREDRGIALTLVLAAIVLVSLALAGVLRLTQHTATESYRDAQLFDARLLAESGLALGQHPDMEPTDPILHQTLENGYQLDVTITSEQGRILINRIIEEDFQTGLEELFLTWGLSPEAALVATQSLKDWVDSDDEAEAQGAEEAFYTNEGREGYPRNGSFLSLEEMLLVRGMDAVAQQNPNWRNAFTLYGNGQIDANAAEADILQAFGGVPMTNAELFVRTRNGGDGILGTEDDELFSGENVEDGIRLLGISQEESDELSGLFTLEGDTLRIQSVATVGTLRYTLVLVADRDTGDSIARYTP
ncbi:MAG: hypothetical protein AAF191_07600 [Verrucomicrobiota bacterium]